jgi:hypothetical protein
MITTARFSWGASLEESAAGVDVQPVRTRAAAAVVASMMRFT